MKHVFITTSGLDRYYGLLELGEKYGVFTKRGNRIVVGESTVYPKSILSDPQKYFTPEVMQALDGLPLRSFVMETSILNQKLTDYIKVPCDKLTDYIRVYDGIADKRFCDDLIANFEYEEHNQNPVDRRNVLLLLN